MLREFGVSSLPVERFLVNHKQTKMISYVPHMRTCQFWSRHWALCEQKELRSLMIRPCYPTSGCACNLKREQRHRYDPVIRLVNSKRTRKDKQTNKQTKRKNEDQSPIDDNMPTIAFHFYLLGRQISSEIFLTDTVCFHNKCCWERTWGQWNEP